MEGTMEGQEQWTRRGKGKREALSYFYVVQTGAAAARVAKYRTVRVTALMLP